MRNQVRRCSRSPCPSIGEAWRHRFYPAAFTSKIIDAEGEAAEVQIWLDLALDCGYITAEEREIHHEYYEGLLRQLVKTRLRAGTWGAINPQARDP